MSRALSEPSDALAWGAAAFTIVAWGSAFTGIAVALQGLGPGELALARFTTASLVLAALALVRRLRRPDLADIPRLAIISLVGISAYHLLLNFGQRVVSPGTAALIIQTAPVFTAMLAARYAHEQIGTRRWIGIGVAAVGTVIIVFGRGLDLDFSGSALLIVGCAAATSVYFVFGRPITQKYGARTMTTWSIWIGTLPLLVFAPSLVRQAQVAPPSVLLATVYVGVVPAALAYVTWNLAVGKLGASRVSVLLYTSPLIAMLTQYAWNRTFPNATAILGGCVAIGGTLIATRGRR